MAVQTKKSGRVSLKSAISRPWPFSEAKLADWLSVEIEGNPYLGKILKKQYKVPKKPHLN